MQTIFEGVATLHLQAYLRYLVDTKKSITLVQLNTIQEYIREGECPTAL